MKMKYNSIIVSSISKSKEFYEKLDLKVIDEYYSDNLSVVMLTDGDIKIELIEDKTKEIGINNIGFIVSNIDKCVEKLEKMGIEFESKDYLTSNFNVASLHDPDGININIIEE